MYARKLPFAIVVVVVLGLAAAPMAGADTTYTVSTTSDTNAVNPAVNALDSSGKISLRSALENLNTSPPSGAVTIKVPAGTYTLTAAGGAGQGTEGALVLSAGVPVTIAGAGASSTTIDANYLDRGLAINSGTVTRGEVSLAEARRRPTASAR